MELEQFIANTGQSKDDIHNDVNDYRALKRKIGNPNSRHDDDDNIRRMKDLHNVYLLGKTICNRQQKIHAARKVATAATATIAAAAAAAIATSNVANTSISSYATSAN